MNERNYLLPVSLQPSADANTTLDTIALQDVNARFEAAGVKTRLLFMDACRDNPFGAVLGSGVSRGLAKVETGGAVSSGTLFAFSTSPNNVAYDGDTALSPFTDAFVRFAPTPKLEIQQTLDLISTDVIAKTNHLQTPWRNASAMNFFLVPHRPPPTFDKTAVVPASREEPTDLKLTVPVQVEGGPVKVALVRLPSAGDLYLGGEKILTEETITAEDFGKLQYRAPKEGPPADAFSFRVSDAWGNEDDGIVTVLAGGAVQTAAATPPEPQPQPQPLGDLESRGVSLLGFGPNLTLTEKSVLAAPVLRARVRLASNVPFGQLVLGDRVIQEGKSISLSDLDHLAFIPPAGSEGRKIDALFTPAESQTGGVRPGDLGCR